MALIGLRVVELGGLAPAPFCGMVLGDFGASVIRVDKIGGGLSLDCLANGKKSLALNLKQKQGAEILKKLCKTSDVLIEPYRKGVMEKLGLGPTILLADNPQLVYARLTGFGQFGPYSDRAGHDINYIAMTGILNLLGRKHENPTPPVNLVADFGGGGLLCAMGILMALLERNSSGLGQVVDANMVEGAAYLSSWLYRSQNLPLWGQPRGENVLDSGAHFYNTYKTKDGKFMAVGALEPQFYDELLRGLGFSEEDMPQYGDFEEKRAMVANRFLQRTRAEWCQVFDNVDACVTPVLSIEEAPSHPHNADRGSFLSDEGNVVPQAAPSLGRTPPVSLANQPRPNLGQHTAELLTELGYSSGDIQDLQQRGIVEASCKAKL